MYALEGFLLRLANSAYNSKFVLKGGVLLAAYELRRPTADVDFAGVRVSSEAESVRQLVMEIAGTALPTRLDDGLTFDLDNTRAETIREDDEYGGVRVRLVSRLSTAREPFHVDVNVGDPIWPAPAVIYMPRLLEQEPIKLRGYPLEMVLAEKIVTALQRGQASTRWQITGRLNFRVWMMRLTAMPKSGSRDGGHGAESYSSRRACPLISVTSSPLWRLSPSRS